MMKHVFVLNGRTKDHPFEKDIKEVMKDKDYEIIYTKSEDDAISIGKQFKDNHYRIYSVGGDGMLNQLLQGLVYSDNEIVVIPKGSANDFYRYLGDEKDCRKVLEKSLAQQAHLVDCGKVNDYYYINTCCFGIDCVIGSRAHDDNVSFLPESMSYYVSLAKRVASYKARYVKIYDEKQIYYEGEMAICAINNAQYYGGGFSATPHASINDGWLDGCVVDKISHWRMPYMFILMMQNKLEGHDSVHTFKSKHLYVDSQYSCNIDGEEIFDHHYEITVIPQSVHLVYDE